MPLIVFPSLVLHRLHEACFPPLVSLTRRHGRGRSPPCVRGAGTPPSGVRLRPWPRLWLRPPDAALLGHPYRARTIRSADPGRANAVGGVGVTPASTTAARRRTRPLFDRPCRLFLFIDGRDLARRPDLSAGGSSPSGTSLTMTTHQISDLQHRWPSAEHPCLARLPAIGRCKYPC